MKKWFKFGCLLPAVIIISIPILWVLYIATYKKFPNSYNGHFEEIEKEGLGHYSDALLFISDSVGFVGGYNDDVSKSPTIYYAQISTTHDRGRSWKTIDICTGGMVRQIKMYNGILYASVEILGVYKKSIGYFSIYESKDKGLSWQLKTTLPEDTLIDDFHFRDSLNWIINHYGSFKETHDGGKSYERIRTGGIRLEINDSVIVTGGLGKYVQFYNYIKKEEVSLVEFPESRTIPERYKSNIGNNKYNYSDSAVLVTDATAENRSILKLYKILPSNEPKLIYTYEIDDYVLRVFMSKSKNNICVSFNVGSFDRFTYFSRDGGYSWTEIKYFRDSDMPMLTIYKNDTIKFWQKNYWSIDFIRIDPESKE